MEMESNHIARRFITDVPDDEAEGAWQRDDVSRIAPADLDPRGDDGGVVFTLRLPHDLHAALLRVAQQRSVSAHTVIIEAVVGYVSVQEDILEWGRRGGEEGNDDNTERRIVFIKPIGDYRFRQWVKVLEGVDTTISNGFAFQGNFIRFNQKGEFPVGTLLLYFGMEGSRRRQQACVELRVVTPQRVGDALRARWARPSVGAGCPRRHCRHSQSAASLLLCRHWRRRCKHPWRGVSGAAGHRRLRLRRQAAAAEATPGLGRSACTTVAGMGSRRRQHARTLWVWTDADAEPNGRRGG